MSIKILVKKFKKNLNKNFSQKIQGWVSEQNNFNLNWITNSGFQTRI